MQKIILVRGSGDIGSAVSHRLFRADYQVAIHDIPQPTVIRRGMAFADALWDGEAMLEGVIARRVDDLGMLRAILSQHALIPLLIADFGVVMQTILPHVLVDARMRKHAQPELQRGLAPVSIGLGPNFVAGVTTDISIETCWGATLGQVLRQGAPLPLTGEPHPIEGVARERYVYAPIEGIFHTSLRIGDAVHAGQVIASIGVTELSAPRDGVLRGLTHDGVFVPLRTKVIEVDPRGVAAVVHGIGERPSRIADGVLNAILQAPVQRLSIRT
jgi:xanthine dehydrogenase accessory factor